MSTALGGTIVAGSWRDWLRLPDVSGTPRYYEMLVNICSAETRLGQLDEAERFATEVMCDAVAPYPKSIAAA